MVETGSVALAASAVEKNAERDAADINQPRKARRVQSRAEEGEGSKLFVQGLSLVAKVPLFSSLELPELPKLVAAFTTVACQPGQVIVRQGDPGRELIVIESGVAALKVEREGKSWMGPIFVQVGVLESGSSMGEVCLLHQKPWSVTIQAVTALQAWKLQSADFEQLGLRQKLRVHRGMRKQKKQTLHLTRGADNKDGGVLYEDDIPVKTDEERALLRQSLLQDIVLGPLARNFSKDELDKIMARAQRLQVAKDTEVVRQGETNAEQFYIIEKGAFVRTGTEWPFKEELGPGRSFGERALLEREPYRWTVRATCDSTLWQLHRQDLKGIERLQLQWKLEHSAVLLSRLWLLRDAPDRELRKLADALREVAFYRGERIVRQGDVGRSLIIIYKGLCDVECTQDGVLTTSRLLGDPEKGRAEFLGEGALLGDIQWPKTVIAADHVIALVLDRDVFLRLTGAKGSPSSGQSNLSCQACSTTFALTPMEKGGIQICPTCAARPCHRHDARKGSIYRRKALKDLGLLGCGRFAQVRLVRCEASSKIFALKSLAKSAVLEKKQMQNVFSEKLILKSTSSPFIIRLFATFNSGPELEFLLEAALGGDLLTLYERHEEFFGSTTHARFYVACVVRGLGHLHERYIIYRDLKMENIMLHPSGYAKLTDFGLSKFVIGHTYTKCGTPDYMAPEIVRGAGHTSAVDWWALGVLTYALMEGSLPFDSSQASFIFWKVQCGIEKVSFSSPDAPWADLVRSLCKQEPRDRLPVRTGGAQGIQEHTWFQEVSFDWTALEQGKVPTPYQPPLTSVADLRHFEADSSQIPKSGPYEDPGDGWDADFEDCFGPLVSELAGGGGE
eukprot:TRINITY_DN23353_c0_g1_i1.p1 TRINITY_DN23353_c0_g1~~TRINITY_DN23353_c0_g1_i1.p1  ORF type:complete len:861 (-),score=156.69 TRINITY_DN23353_c0_g1_i1:39-2576(-)